MIQKTLKHCSANASFRKHHQRYKFMWTHRILEEDFSDAAVCTTPKAIGVNVMKTVVMKMREASLIN